MLLCPLVPGRYTNENQPGKTNRKGDNKKRIYIKSQGNGGVPLKRKDKWCKRTTKKSKKNNDSIPLAEFEPSCTRLSFASNHDEGWTALLLELVKANLLWWLGLMHALHTLICKIAPPGRIQGSPSNVDSRSDRQWQWNGRAPDVTISPSHFFTIIKNLSPTLC